MGKVADLSVFTPGGQPGAPNPSEGLAALRQNQTAFMETIGVMPPESLTIVDGAISPTTAVCIVDAEGGAPADDLTTINATLSDGGTLHDGMVILLSAKDASRVVTVKNSDASNGVKTVDGKDIALSPEWCLVLQYVGGVWQQINVSAPLKPATETTLGGVKVGDGLTMRDGVMSADLATDAKAGRVKASEAAKAGAVPLGGADGSLDKGWLGTLPDDIDGLTEDFNALANVAEVVNSSGDGWIRYESGIQLCWGGGLTNASGGVTITLPVPYTNILFSVSLAITGDSGSLAAQIASYVELNSSTKFTVWAATGGKPAPSAGFLYFTIGRWK